jgi:predicted dinucleotide-utilizing enzyme
MKIKVALIGLGRVGSLFLGQIINKKSSMEIVMVVEPNETPGKLIAEEEGIPVGSIEDIIAKGEEIDLVFDLTANPEVRQQLRTAYQKANNRHTIIVPDIVASFIYNLLTEKDLTAARRSLTAYD